MPFFDDLLMNPAPAIQRQESTAWDSVVLPVLQRERPVETVRQQEVDQNSPGVLLTANIERMRRERNEESVPRYMEGRMFNDINRRLPFIGAALSVNDAVRVRNAALRIRDGEAESADYGLVATHLVDAERAGNRSFLENVGNIVSHLPGFAAEFVATGGVFTAGRAGGARLATAGITRLAGQAAAESLPGRVAAQSAGYLAGSAAQAAAMPQRILADSSRRAVPGITTNGESVNIEDRGSAFSPGNLSQGFLDTWIEVGSERAGEALPWAGQQLNRVPIVNRVREGWLATRPGAAISQFNHGLRDLAERMGVPYHGMGGEIFEERVGEVLRGLTRLEPDYGTVGDILSGRFGKAGEQLLAEAMAFSAVPIAYGVARRGLHARGISPETTQERITELATFLDQQVAQNPNITPAAAQAAAQQQFRNPVLAVLAHDLVAGRSAQSENKDSVSPVTDTVYGNQTSTVPPVTVETPTIAPEALAPEQGSTLTGTATQAATVTPATGEALPGVVEEVPNKGRNADRQGKPPVEVIQAMKQIAEELGVSKKGSWLDIQRKIEKHPQGPALLAGMDQRVELEREINNGKIADKRIAPSYEVMDALERTNLEPRELAALENVMSGLSADIISNMRDGSGKPIVQNGVGGPVSHETVRKYAEKAFQKLKKVTDKFDKYPTVADYISELKDKNKDTLGETIGGERITEDQIEQIDALLDEEAALKKEIEADNEKLKALGKRLGISEEGVRQDAEGASAEDLAARKRARASGQATKWDRAGNVLHGATPIGKSAQAGTDQSNTGKAVGQFEIIAQIKQDIGMTAYIEKDNPPGFSKSDIAYLKKQRAAVVGNMRAGDAEWWMHEAGHHLALKYKMLEALAKADQEVRDGMAQFDYQPQRAMGDVKLLEGFSEWLRLRTNGELEANRANLSAEQVKAAHWAEQFVASTKVNIDRVRQMFAKFNAMTPAKQAAGQISPTGQQVKTEKTFTEQFKGLFQTLSEWTQDNVESDLNVLTRMGEEMRSRGQNPAVAKAVRDWYGNMMYMAQSWAGEFEAHGVKTLIDGQWKVIGLPLDKILESLSKEDLAAFHGELSKFEVFAVARHVAQEHLKGREVVSEEQNQYFRDALEEFLQDPAFIERATVAADKLTAAFNSTLEALASKDVHYLTRKMIDTLVGDKATYLPLGRIKEGFARNNDSKELDKRRKGSGEQIISPLLSYKKRLAVTAWIMTEQLKKNAMADLLSQEGMGKWGVESLESEVGIDASIVDTKDAKFKELLSTLGLADSDLADILKQMNVQASYFVQQPWPSDGSRPTFWWRGPEGKMTNFRIADKALWELISNTQGDGNAAIESLRWLSRVNIAGVNILPAMNKMVRTGATTLSLGFQVRNIPRDTLEFVKNSMNPKSVAELPAFYAAAFLAEYQVQTGQTPSNVYFKMFHEMRGQDLRYMAFDKKNPSSIYSQLRDGSKSIKEINGIGDLLRWTYNAGKNVGKGVFNVAGAGELAPRALELKNFLDKAGYTEKAIRDLEAKGEDIPYFVKLQAMTAAAEVTTPFQRQGTLTRELNKIHPFFGPAVAGFSKQIRNWKDNTKMAAVGLAGVLGLRLVYWLKFHDEDWYKELNANDRYNTFVVPIPGMGLRRLPGPRGLDIPAGGILMSMLDKANNQNPDFAGLLRQSVEGNAPPLPITPLGEATLAMARNRNWMGQPIIPRRDENLPASHNLIEHQLPYVAQQLTGGRAELSLKGLGLVPFSEVRNAQRSISEYYDLLHQLSAERTLATRQGGRYEREAEYRALHQIEERMQRLSQEARGERRIGTHVIQGEKPSEERIRDIRTQQAKLARQILDYVTKK